MGENSNVKLPATMKAAQVVEHGKPLQVNTIPVPKPGAGEVLVKVQANGVCHTDVHVNDGELDVKCPLPMTPGHEVIGVVAALGAGVGNLKVGDRVGIPWLHESCGSCADCWAGWETVCAKTERTGFSVHGGFAEYALANATYATPIPDSLSNEQAAPILCAGVTVYKALKESSVRPGQYVVINGAGGGLGHVAVQYAKAMGMVVIAIDSGDRKMKLLKEDLKVEHVVDFTRENVAEAILKITDTGAHGCLMLAPTSKPFAEAVGYIRPRGTIVCVGLPPGSVPVNVFQVVLKAITIKGSIVGTRLDLQEALLLAARGKVKCHVVVKSMKEVNGILDSLRNGEVDGRVVIDMSNGF